eukprot:scaffold95577_cov24-Tisochrysis_lutea.AAC.3
MTANQNHACFDVQRVFLRIPVHKAYHAGWKCFTSNRSARDSGCRFTNMLAIAVHPKGLTRTRQGATLEGQGGVQAHAYCACAREGNLGRP